jgi:GntR family histidine utilization transcriptional repressor
MSSPPPLQSAKATNHPLHEQIRASIERKILTGALKPGDRIPFEHELMESFDCSRMTVSKALAGLVSKGLVVRRRRAGSFVAHPPSASTLLDVPDIQADIQGRGLDYAYQLLSRRLRAPLASRREECELAKGGQLLDLTCLHVAGGTPFAYESRLISLETVPDARMADFSVSPPGTWLLDHVPWSQAQHRISAAASDARLSKLLDVSIGAPCLVLERTTWHGNRPVTQVRQTFPGERHAFLGAFSHT